MPGVSGLEPLNLGSWVGCSTTALPLLDNIVVTCDQVVLVVTTNSHQQFKIFKWNWNRFFYWRQLSLFLVKRSESLQKTLPRLPEYKGFGGWCSVRVEVRSGITILVQFQRCTSVGGVVFCTGRSVPNPVPIIGLFSYSPSSNQTYYLRGVLHDNKFRFDYQYYF